MSWKVYYTNGKIVKPRKYPCGKSQDFLVEELVEAYSKGAKRVILQAAPGTGKSLIALLTFFNLYGKNGKGIVVVPTKALQIQYSEDYGGKKFIIGEPDNPLSIGFIWGRRNFKCPLNPQKYYCDNAPCVNELKYASIIDKIDSCPFYNKPLTRKQFEKIVEVFGEDNFQIVTEYKTVTGLEYVIYRRRNGNLVYGCPYYEQFIQYATKDVIVLNDKMWFFEKRLGRIVAYDFEILDEFDTIFLSHLPKINVNYVEYIQTLLDFTRKYKPNDDVEESMLEILQANLRKVKYMFKKVKTKDDLLEVVDQLLNLKIEYIDIFQHADEEVEKIFSKIEFIKDILNRFYSIYEFVRRGNKILLICIEPKDYYKNTILKYSDYADRKILFMSATPLNEFLLREMFGIVPDEWIKGEVKVPGICYLGGTFTMEVSGKQFINNLNYRKKYAEHLYDTIIKARLEVNNILGIVTAKKYIEALRRFKQMFIPYDEDGTLLEKFRKGEIDEVWTTRAFRGIDLPHCHGIIMTKYPFPELNDPFWMALRDRRPHLFKSLYNWIAEITLFQSICRALRDENCWVVIYSPDAKVKIKILEFARQNLLNVKPFQSEIYEKYRKLFEGYEVKFTKSEWERVLKVNKLITELVNVQEVENGVIVKLKNIEGKVLEQTQVQEEMVEFGLVKAWEKYPPGVVIKIPKSLALKLESEGYGMIINE